VRLGRPFATRSRSIRPGGLEGCTDVDSHFQRPRSCRRPDGLSLDHPVIGWHNLVTATTIIALTEQSNSQHQMQQIQRRRSANR
jgi:hypothetical protein